MNARAKTFACTSASALVLILLLAYANHRLNADQQNPWLIAVCALLFLIFVYALIPPFVHLFVVLQGRVGNAELAPVAWLRGHERRVSWMFWAMFTLGLMIALPVILVDAGWRMPIGPTQGSLVANVGMTLEAVARRSSLPLAVGTYFKLDGSRKVIADQVFDFEIAGTATRFERCRYYWIETGKHDDPRIDNLNIGISTRAVTRAELAKEAVRVQQQLAHDGWLPGQYYYRTAEQRSLHGGATSSGFGWHWQNADTILHLEQRRTDDAKVGEDLSSAGEWIQYIQLWPRTQSIFAGVEFGPPPASDE